jgi:two-component system C4-dicarboxylate transport sensor histidine kinase DctB
MRRITHQSTSWLLTAGLLLALCLIWRAGIWTYEAELDALSETGEERLSLYTGTLLGAINRYAYLPYVLANNESVKEMLKSGHAEATNQLLEDLNKVSGSAALYIMDKSGDTLASSNWRDELSFVGNNYSYRPYFTDAVAGRQGRFFAIGSTTGRPGFFMSQPIVDASTVVGVAVTKIDLDPLQDEWREGGETVLVSDGNGVLFLSSRQDWKYKVLNPLSQSQKEAIRVQRQYGDKQLDAVALSSLEKVTEEKQLVRAEKTELLMLSRPLPILGWKLLYLAPMSSVHEKTRAVAIIGTVLSLLFLAMGMYLRERHHKRLSRDKAREAEAIKKVNLRLAEEVEEHCRTEQALRDAQTELVQTSKLAALGQMAAGIVHELNQPIAAIRTHAASGKLLLDREQPDKLRETLGAVSRITDHMSEITAQLKSFAYKTPKRDETVDFKKSLDSALSIVANLLSENDIILSTEIPDAALLIEGNNSQIEQVIVNLVRNSVDAMHGCGQKRLLIALSVADGMLELKVSDSGEGIAEENLGELFTPFFTTKEVGKGLGLGLPICYRIVSDLGGTIRALNNRGGAGATFIVSLPIVDREARTSL